MIVGGIFIKSRKQKAILYENNYKDIPRDYQERLSWMYDKYNLNPNKANYIYKARNDILESMKYEEEIFVVLYEEPEGTPRPRARYINKKNLTNSAKKYPGFINVYSITGKPDRQFMHRMITEEELVHVDNLLCTPCEVEYTAFFKTPSNFNITLKFLAELGLQKPIYKPDFDNIAKKYSDMYNSNVWVDDSLVTRAIINKYYSILPRVEIKLKYMNMLYNKHQYNSIMKRKDIDKDRIVNYYNLPQK